MPLLANTGCVAPLLAELLARHPHPRQGLRQVRQVPALQELDVNAQVADPVNGLAIKRHQLIAVGQHICPSAHHATGLADKVQGVLGQQRDQARAIDPHRLGKGCHGGQNIRQGLPGTVDALAPGGCQGNVRIGLHRRNQAGHTVRGQHIVVVQELDVKTAGQPYALDGVAHFMQGLLIALIANGHLLAARIALDDGADHGPVTVIANDDFQVGIGLRASAGKRRFKPGGFVGRYDHTDQRQIFHGVTLLLAKGAAGRNRKKNMRTSTQTGLACLHAPGRDKGIFNGGKSWRLRAIPRHKSCSPPIAKAASPPAATRSACPLRCRPGPGCP